MQPGIREALTSIFAVVSDRAHARRLANLVHELSGLWRVRVTMGLRSRRIPTLSALLREPGPDLLGIFRKEDVENAHSDVLRWLLDPREAPTIAPVLQRLDDVVRAHARSAGLELPGAQHQERANTVRFVQRGLTSEFQPETAFNDVKVVLDLLLSADAALAEAVGVDPAPGKAES